MRIGKPAVELAAVAPQRWRGEGAGALDTRSILTGIEEVAYEWMIPDDRLYWDTNAADVLSVASTWSIATGDGYAGLLDPASATTRHDAVLNSKATDDGSGVLYQVQYGLLLEGAGSGRRLMVEDVGRWFAGKAGRPERACGVVRVINERYEREQRLAFLSRYDELTGCLNRSYLLSALSEALVSARRRNVPIAFMIVAVDSFRAINEAYGFEVADQMFATVAQRIKATLREGDTIGRLSGNKLGVIAQDCDERDIYAAAERFHATVRADVVATEAGSVALTASIGGVGLPRHGRSVGGAIAHAQEALDLARLRGHGRFVAYFPSTERDDQRRSNAELSGDLVAAFNQHRFVLGFQPVVDAKTRTTVFHEALLRMRRPNNPLSEAGDFVQAAERLGLIRLVDGRALELVFEMLAETADARMAFNISAETIGDSDWLSRLSAQISEHEDLARRLIVEITETALMHNLDEAISFVSLLHDLGCEVALDDFGAGFSSFRSLRDLGVDLIKIDGSFVEKLATSRDDRVFVQTLINLARNLGIRSVAERVQDEDAAILLTEWGVDYLQGNLTGAVTLEWPGGGEADDAANRRSA